MQVALEPFEAWLVHKSWALAVRYSRAVAWLLPPAALAADMPYFRGTLGGGLGSLGDTGVPWPAGLGWLLAWQLVAELVCILVVVADRLLPRTQSRAVPLYLFCTVFMGMTTWVGLADGALHGDLALYAAGSTFVASAICTPLPVRRWLYVLSFAALGLGAWGRTGDDVAALVAAMVNPFCVVVLCIELDKLTHARNVALYAERQRAEAEHARADRVLYNVLPASVADELKRDQRVSAVKFDNMGVLFADIAGFTSFSQRLPPDALVLVLGQIFSSFDALVERHGVEKIKTIGDAYMAVSYVGAVALCELAVGMRDALHDYNRANGTTLALRIGIHAGPAVAGVIGAKRFLYDVWGDTVNIASRLEACGEPGAIQVSTAVHAQAQAQFAFGARAPVQLRGRGVMQTWWLLGPINPGAPRVLAPAASPVVS